MTTRCELKMGHGFAAPRRHGTRYHYDVVVSEQLAFILDIQAERTNRT